MLVLPSCCRVWILLLLWFMWVWLLVGSNYTFVFYLSTIQPATTFPTLFLLFFIFCYSCCLVKAGATLTLSSHWCNFSRKLKMTLFLSLCNYQILHFDDVNFLNNLYNISMIFKYVLFNDFDSMLLSSLNILMIFK